MKVGPLPKWIDAPLSYKASFADWERKVPGKYPIQYTHTHYLRRVHIDPETGTDIAGADNMLTDSTHSTTPHLNAWNSNLCQYEKYEGPLDLVPDYQMDPIVPIAD